MIGLILMIIAFVGMWKTFEKAGMEGWKGIVPVYNMYLLITEIAKNHGGIYYYYLYQLQI
ncbi:hypothetical protein [Fusobacterium ulcerans]|uniref:hypothetical protein n=1 Tax=Fusobacterium ulcerans TaxID=861 RepID=UPI0024203A83|nr:hypothetical protein [Fusobacterium ulcerans]